MCCREKVKRLCWLKRIDLVFSMQLTEIGLNYISQGFKKMKFLEHVHLQSYSYRHTEKGLYKWSGSLNRLAKLKDISLMTPDSNITNACLANMKFKRLVSLEEISLFFKECDELTNKGLYFLTRGLMGLPNLQKIYLDFWECSKFSDKGLHYLWKMMRNLPSLRVINLIFSVCSKITDATCADLNHTLKPLVSVQEFGLTFYDCDEITDAGVTSLCQTLERFDSLQSLSLDSDFDNEMIDLERQRPHLHVEYLDEVDF